MTSLYVEPPEFKETIERHLLPLLKEGLEQFGISLRAIIVEIKPVEYGYKVYGILHVDTSESFLPYGLKTFLKALIEESLEELTKKTGIRFVPGRFGVKETEVKEENEKIKTVVEAPENLKERAEWLAKAIRIMMGDKGIKIRSITIKCKNPGPKVIIVIVAKSPVENENSFRDELERYVEMAFGKDAKMERLSFITPEDESPLSTVLKREEVMKKQVDILLENLGVDELKKVLKE